VAGGISLGLEVLSLKGSLVDVVRTGDVPDDLVVGVVNNGIGRGAVFDVLDGQDDAPPVFAPHLHAVPDVSGILDGDLLGAPDELDFDQFVANYGFTAPSSE